MARWLLKSEPDAFSWSQMHRDGATVWDGVRNHQATRNLKSMAVGDLAFFYHSNVGREIVGIVRVTEPFRPDPAAPGFGWVRVEAVAAVPRPVSLAAIKADPALQGMALVRQSRLSVCPVSEPEWRRLCELAGCAATFFLPA